MANQRMQDSWKDMKSNIRATWGNELTDEILDKGRRDLNKMVDIIHENTGSPRAKIRTQLSAMV
ncbi:MAG: general stress protein CsbD [Rhodothermaceae bacterium]|nr:general stress protein CsbD [Rhodothermaceae bacterium]